MTDQKLTAAETPTASSRLLNSSNARWQRDQAGSIIGYDAEGLADADKLQLRRYVDDLLISAGYDEVVDLISQLFVATKRTGSDLQEKSVVLKVYAGALHDLSRKGLIKACGQLLQTETFFPSVAEIRKVADEIERPLRAARIATQRQVTRERGGGGPEHLTPLLRDMLDKGWMTRNGPKLEMTALGVKAGEDFKAGTVYKREDSRFLHNKEGKAQ